MDIFDFPKIIFLKLSVVHRYIKCVYINIETTFSFAKLAHYVFSHSLDEHPFPFKCLLNDKVIVQSEGNAKLS